MNLRSIFTRAKERTALGILTLTLLFAVCCPNASAQGKVTVGSEGYELSSFNEVETRKVALVTHTDNSNTCRVGVLKGSSLEEGAIVRLIRRVGKIIKKVRRRFKSLRGVNRKRARRQRVRLQDFKTAKNNCRNGESSAGGVEPNEKKLGTNLFFLNQSDTSIVFANAMKQASQWFAIGPAPDFEFNTGVDIPLDDNGYPLEIPYADPESGDLQTVVSFLFDNMDGQYPAGTYTLIFEGSGELVLSGDISEETGYTTGGTYSFNVNSPSDEGLIIEISSSSSDDRIRSIQLILPNLSTTDQFNPAFLSAIAGFSPIRFMNHQQINSGVHPCSDNVSPSSTSCVREWEDRATTGQRTYSGSTGVPYEVLIDIANAAEADPWINIHHGSTDEHIRELATLVRDRLDSGRNVYIELSNEIWNSDTPYLSQRTFAGQRGIELGFDSDEELAREKYITHMTCNIGEIFDDVFDSGRSRVKIIMPGFIVDDEGNRRQLAAQSDSSICESGRKADALAIAPYFGVELASRILAQNLQDSATVDELIAEGRREITENFPNPADSNDTVVSIASYIEANCSVVNDFNIPLVAYEGGQHMVEGNGESNNATLAQKLIEANQNEGMGAAFSELYDVWFGDCGGVFNTFSFAQKDSPFFGAFGLLSDLYDSSGNQFTTSELEENHPKYQATRDELRERGQLD